MSSVQLEAGAAAATSAAAVAVVVVLEVLVEVAISVKESCNISELSQTNFCPTCPLSAIDLLDRETKINEASLSF